MSESCLWKWTSEWRRGTGQHWNQRKVYCQEFQVQRIIVVVYFPTATINSQVQGWIGRGLDFKNVLVSKTVLRWLITGLNWLRAEEGTSMTAQRWEKHIHGIPVEEPHWSQRRWWSERGFHRIETVKSWIFESGKGIIQKSSGKNRVKVKMEKNSIK